MISKAERDFILQGFDYGVRSDGRKPLQYRELAVQSGVLQQASGSARCQLGLTEALVAIKADIGVPFPETPDQGGLEVTIDFAACAVQGRNLDAQALELAKTLQRSLRWEEAGSGCAIDLEALKIISGKRCWVLTIDGLILSADGNLVDALSIAIKAALADLRIPHIDITMGEEGVDPELDLDDDPERAISLDTSRTPVVITVSQVCGVNALDLTEDEEAAAGAASLHLAVNAKGHLCGLSKNGGSAIRLDRVMGMIEAAQRVGPHLHRAINSTAG